MISPGTLPWRLQAFRFSVRPRSLPRGGGGFLPRCNRLGRGTRHYASERLDRHEPHEPSQPMTGMQEDKARALAGKAGLFTAEENSPRVRKYEYLEKADPESKGRGVEEPRRKNRARREPESNDLALRDTRSKTPALTESKSKNWSDRSIRTLPDAVKLANQVAFQLSKGKVDEAFERAREASKDGQYPVSWNHLLDHDLAAGKVQAAFKTFTEMRKRGQRPDSHTYTILLRGLTENVHKTESAVQRTLDLLHLLRASTSEVRLATIHVNAALEVCANARNLDAIYSIAAMLPETGAGAPDRVSFTIILECLRVLVEKPASSAAAGPEPELEKRRKDHILQGKRLWADVIHRWLRGELVMDELLVHAMGRLLLLGDLRNHDEILSLVAQTTNLPREVPAIGDPGRQTHLRGSDAAAKRPIEDVTAEGSSPEWLPAIRESDDLEGGIESAKLFDPTKPGKLRKIAATPGNRVLALVMQACTQLRATEAAQRYWGTITRTVEPDVESINQYMRLLRLQRNSRLAVELLRQVCTPKDEGGLGLPRLPVTFRLAMHTCVRNGDSPSCLADARAVLDLQAAHLKTADVRVGLMLVDLLARRAGQWPLAEMIPTLDMLDALWVNLKHFVAYGDGDARGLQHEVTGARRAEITQLTARYHRLIARSLAVYREQLAEGTGAAWQQRLARNHAKLERWQATNHADWRPSDPARNPREIAVRPTDGERRRAGPIRAYPMSDGPGRPRR